MNKLLTTIILLCFSVAANADIYFCEAKAIGTISADGDASSLGGDDMGSNNDGISWVVDTDKGFRSADADGYSGESCELELGIIYCGLSRGGVEIMFAINAERLTFTSMVASHGDAIAVAAGTCTKA
jgi:hypothetical protein